MIGGHPPLEKTLKSDVLQMSWQQEIRCILLLKQALTFLTRYVDSVKLPSQASFNFFD